MERRKKKKKKREKWRENNEELMTSYYEYHSAACESPNNIIFARFPVHETAWIDWRTRELSLKRSLVISQQIIRIFSLSVEFFFFFYNLK